MTMTMRLFSPALLAVIGVILRLIKPAVAHPIVKIPVEIPRSGFNPLLPTLEMEVYHPALVQSLGFNKEAILKKIWDWQGYNRHEKQTFRDGHYWTYYTYEQWQQKHFQWLNVDTVRKLIRELENDGLLISGQFSYGSATKWYRVDVNAVSKLLLRTEKASVASGQKRRKAGEVIRAGGEKTRIKTIEESTKKNQQIKNAKTKQQQPLQDTDETTVVVVLPSSEPEAESGEHSIDGEGQDTTAVKAIVMHEQHHNEPPFPKVPQKGFPISALAADLVKFKVLPVTAQRLADQYPEADVRYVLEYARGESSLHNPPGFVVDELDTRKHGVLAARDSNLMQKDLHASPAPKRFIPPDDFVCTDEEREEIGLIGFERFIALRRENERSAAQAVADPEYA